jgi:uncharacterized protein (DUF983 family)
MNDSIAHSSNAPAEWTSGEGSIQQDRRALWPAIWRGLRMRCPACGAGKLFASYLKVSNRCEACGEDLSHHRADDAPPYFTILIAGHVIVPLLMTVELAYAPPVWLHLAIWLPLTVMLCLAVLPRAKGAIVGLQWANRMHGFGDERPENPGAPSLEMSKS